MLYKYNHYLSSMTFIHFGNSTILTGLKYNPKKDFTLNKPTNALWASPYTSDKPYKSDWEEYCIKNSLVNKVEEYTSFRLKSDAKILIINSANDLLSMDEKYIHKDFNFNTPITYNVFKIDNIEADFDGIFVTERGLRECQCLFHKWEVQSLALFTSDVVVKLFKDNL